MEDIDLSTFAARLRAVADGRIVRNTYRDGSWGEVKLVGEKFVERDQSGGWDEGSEWSCHLASSPGSAFSAVHPEPKTVEEMTWRECVGELSGDRNDLLSSDATVRRLVAEKRAREAREARTAEIDAMTLGALRDRFWFGHKTFVFRRRDVPTATLSDSDVAEVTGSSTEEAVENLRVCLAALAKKKEGL